MFGKVTDDSFTHIFDLSLDAEDKFSSSFQNNNFRTTSSSSSSPMSSRRDFSSPSSTISTPSSSSSLPLEAAFNQFAASFSSLLADNSSAASAALTLDKKICELERLRNKINNDNHSSASSTTSSSSNSASATKVNASRYKTELCRPFSEFGTCKYGEKCQFAHGQSELRTVSRHPKYKTDLCRTYHSVGFCPYGPRCHFIHNMEEYKKEQAQLQQQQKSRIISNSPIGSGRLNPNQLDMIKPLPMFDHQKPSKNVDNYGSSTWTPLNSSFPHHHEDLEANSRLPVFSTLSK